MALLTKRTILSAAMLAVFGTAHAQSDLTALPLESLLQMRVITASSYDQSAAEAPSAVSIITAEDIRNHGYRTLADALASLPGLYVTDDLSYSYLGSRGFTRIGDYNGRFQLSVNGLRTNEALFDMAYLGTEFPLDMALIERIEFAPGPGSSIYGSNAMLGVINVITKTGADLAGWRASAAAGGNNLREVAVSYGRRFDNGLEVLASVSGLRTDGQDFRFPVFDTPPTPGGLAAGQNGERYRRGYLRATYGGFDFEAFGGRRDKTVPGIYLGGDFAQGNRLLDNLQFTALRYQRELAADLRVEARLSTGSFGYGGVYTQVDLDPNRDDAQARWRGGELRLVSSQWKGHKIVAGVELQQDTRLDQDNATGTEVFLERRDTGRRSAVYVQDEMRINQRWLLNAGVRYDRNYSFGSSTNPRLALIGEIAPGTTLKLLYGSAFRAPNAYELYYETSAFVSNTTLGAERLTSTEAVLEQQLGERTRWRASIFHYKFVDLIEQVVEDEGYVYRNRGAVTGRGAELSLTMLLPAGVRASASSAYADVRLDDGQRLTNSPRYTAKLALDALIADTGVRAAIDTGIVGPRLDRDRQTVPASVVANLVFTTDRPWHGATFSLGVYNLFDRSNMQPVSDYFAPAQVPGLARTLRLGVEWRR